MARLIAQSGFSGTIGGTVTVYGTAEIQTITVADEPGTVSFDASFNRGGNVIVFTKAASQYQVLRIGSSIQISDGDTIASIPVGTAANLIQFADGDRSLRYDKGFLLGDQAIDTLAKPITAPATQKAALADDTSAQASRVILSNESLSVGGKLSVFGGSGSDTVKIVGSKYNISFDASFNRGGDRVVLEGKPESYLAQVNGSSAVVSNEVSSFSVPIGTKGLAISFENETRNLVYNGGKFFLGNQAINQTKIELSTFEQNINFQESLNAFSGPAPLEGEGSNNKPAIFDINNDGYLDILFWWMVGAPVLGGNYGSQPANARIQLLINNRNNTFTDETLKYFNSDQVDGGTDSFVIKDFNKDGILDIVFATSREDGRNTDNPFDATNNLNGFISNIATGKHDNIKFGMKAWYFYVGSFDINGVTYISASGSAAEKSTQEVFTFVDGEFRLVEGILPARSASDPWQPFSLGINYIFHDSDGDGSADMLFHTSARGHLFVNGVETEAYTSGLDGFRYNYKDNTWVHAGSYFPMNEKRFVKDVKFIGWNLNEGVQPIFEYGPSMYSVRNDVYLTSTMIKVNPLGPPLYASLVGSTFFSTDDIDKVQSINEWDLTPRVYVAFFDVSNGSLQRVNYKVNGLEGMDFFGAHYLYAMDYNRDGYQDLVISTWNKTSSPIILLNDKNNSFNKYDIYVEDRDYIVGSFFADFNNDGNLDILSYISDGSHSMKNADMSQFHLYIGTSSINIG